MQLLQIGALLIEVKRPGAHMLHRPAAVRLVLSPTNQPGSHRGIGVGSAAPSGHSKLPLTGHLVGSVMPLMQKNP